MQFGKFNHIHSFRDFKKDCPTGLLEKKKILELYEQILPEGKGNTKFFAEQIFRLFDMDRNGVIDFKVPLFFVKSLPQNIENQEFMVAIDMTAEGSPEEKLKWAFKMYDRNESGTFYNQIFAFINILID